MQHDDPDALTAPDRSLEESVWFMTRTFLRRGVARLERFKAPSSSGVESAARRGDFAVNRPAELT